MCKGEREGRGRDSAQSWIIESALRAIHHPLQDPSIHHQDCLPLCFKVSLLELKESNLLVSSRWQSRLSRKRSGLLGRDSGSNDSWPLGSGATAGLRHIVSAL